MADGKDKSANSGFILVVISHALNHTYDTLLPILYPAIISEFNLSYGSVGMLVMGYRLFSGVLQIIMGFLGRFVKKKILLGFGMIWQSVANAFTTLSPGFGSMFIARSFAGVGASPQHPTGAAYIAENFPKNRLGRAMGLNLTAAQAGRFITPFIGSLVLMSIGWRATLLAFSIPGLVVGIIFLFVAESKPSGDRTDQFTLTVLITGMREVLRNRTVLMVMVVEMTMAFRMGASDFIPSYLVRDLSMTPTEAGVMFTIFLGSGLFAPYLWGYLSDRFGRRRVLMLAMGAATVLWFLIPYGRNNYQLVLILIPLGVVCQGVGGIIQAFVGEVTTKENRDLVYGIYFTLAYSVGSLSPVILGYLADSFGFQMGFSYVALVSLSAIIAAYFLK
jgi:FSR family fosmidomycin resistance protein-like MFS transporter